MSTVRAGAAALLIAMAAIGALNHQNAGGRHGRPGDDRHHVRSLFDRHGKSPGGWRTRSRTGWHPRQGAVRRAQEAGRHTRPGVGRPATYQDSDADEYRDSGGESSTRSTSEHRVSSAGDPRLGPLDGRTMSPVAYRAERRGDAVHRTGRDGGAAVLAGSHGGTTALAGRQGGATARTGRHGTMPIVIAHRGASALRPEHTLPAYNLAVRSGADYIEPDLVSTKDHVLVARHENELSQTTDVARHPEFAARRTTKVINGVRRTGWFTEDFTLAELRTLRARDRHPGRRGGAGYGDRATIPTLDEIVRLAQRRGVGVYAETKFPSYFASIGLPLEEPMLATFSRYGWDDATDPVFVESFETGNLKKLSTMTHLRLIQFIGGRRAPFDLVAAGDTRTYDDMVTPEGLREIARYADGIGVNTRRIVPRGPDGRLGPPTSLVDDAHAAGLLVHVSTVRAQNGRLPADYRRGDPAVRGYRGAAGDVAGWLDRLYGLKVDGVFADDPGVARVARDRLFSRV
ncbi:glycerophosphodiester phosphodiesterase [Streptosporangium sp. NPDC004379]|uniref:glycerophosphodiester phosphodiesterase n=1 Tax=Streptosporangium sp. NPDC004379 TaxID=3366189 RepID=UPI0036A73D06